MRLIRRLRSDDGITITEVMVATILIGLITAAFWTAMAGFIRNTRAEELKAQTQSELRLEIAGLVVDLRQATAIGVNPPIRELSDRHIAFVTDRIPTTTGPEHYTYELRNCSGSPQICELWRETRFAQAPGYTTFPAAADADERIVEGVIFETATPLFRGAEWVSGSKVYTTQCGGAFPRCEFPLVEVHWRADPDPEDTAIAEVELREEVRLRNA